MSVQAVVVVDPVSSGRRYGIEISRRGLSSVALITRERYLGLHHRLHSSEGFDVVVEAAGFKEIIEKLSAFNIKAIIPGSDTALRIIDKLAGYYKLIGNPVESSSSRHNKYALKCQLRSRGVPATQAMPLSSAQVDAMASLHVDFPVVVKPRQGVGSKNVKICQNYVDVKNAVYTIETEDDGQLSGEDNAMVEGFIEGPEFFMVTGNFGVGRKKHLLCFAEYEKIVSEGNPSIYKNIRSLSTISKMAKSVFRYVERVNGAIEANYGINDVELKLTRTGPLIIEQNGRLPGANVPMLIKECTGLNCYHLNLDIYLGQADAGFNGVNYNKHFCVCCLISYREGYVERVGGLDEVRKLASFYSVDLLVAPGDVIDKTQDFLSAWGFVYLVHEEPNVLMEHSKIVHDLIVVQYRQH